jgi:putative FmdB family regulatory protein
MPLYEYECQSCGKRTEVLQRFDDPPLAVCPSCGGEVKKLISSPAFQFKGTGWYVTDYAGKKAPGDSKSKSEGKSEGSGEKADKAEKAEKSDKAEKTEKPAAASETKSSSSE